MSSILFSLPELFSHYKSWVSSHPQLASDFETTVKWVSYFIAGRINNSKVISELVYSLSNLLVLLNDRIICKAQKLELPGSGDKLKLWLTILEYSQVFFELSAKKLWGETGKWAIVIILQIFKCISRLVLLFQHQSNIIDNPPIQILKRKKTEEAVPEFGVNDARTKLESIAFVLRRSGKVIRKVETSPPIALRNWKPVSVPSQNEIDDRNSDQSLTSRQIIAESVYALKPMVHLLSVYRFGYNTWKPWILSLLLDLTSLQLHKMALAAKLNTMNRQQRLQISKRSFGLLMYLMRSPFYDRHSKDRVQTFLASLGRKIPLVGLICSPLAQYIPHWQRTYFYMWST